MLRNKLILLSIGFYIFWLGIFPLALKNLVVFGLNNLFTNNNYTMQVINPQTKLSVLPILTLKADKILITSNFNSDKFEIDNLNTTIRLLPLFSGKFHINSILADRIRSNINLTKDLELDKDILNKIKRTKISCNSIIINDFETCLFQKDIQQPITHYGSNLILQHNNRYIKFKMISNLVINDRHSNSNWNLYLPKNNDIKKTVFDVQVTNFNISPLRAYLKHYLPNELTELNGSVNMHANKGKLITDLSGFSAIMKDPAKSIILPNKLTISSKFNINKNVINIENVNINSDKINLNLDGRIFDYFGKSMPTLDINLRINNSRIEDIIKFLPPFNIEELNAYKLKKYKFYGNILANINIKGRLPEPDINGDIYISDGVLVKRIPNTNQGATIKISATGRHANFEVLVPAGSGENVKVIGNQEIYNIKFADMSVKSSENINLKNAQDILTPLHEILNFIIGPVPILDLNGYGNIDIIAKGNRKNPHVWGIMNIKDATVNFKEIPDIKLKNSDATLTFNDQNVSFLSKKGEVNGKDFSLNGTCNLYGKFDFDIKSDNQPTDLLYQAIQTSTLIPDIKKVIPIINKITGNTSLNLKIYGNVNSLQNIKFYENVFAKGNIIFKDNRFIIHNINVENSSGNIKLDGINTEANITASIDNLPLKIKSKIKKDVADIVLNIPKLNPNFLIEDIDTRSKQYLPYISVTAKYKGDVNDIQYNKLNLDAKILEPTTDSKIKLCSGQISILNNKINLRDIKGYIGNNSNTIESNLIVSEAFSKEPIFNGYIALKTPDLALLNDIISSDILPKNIKNYTKNFKFDSGKADLDLKIINNKLNFHNDIGGIKFTYLPLGLPIEIINGTIYIKNNIMKLHKINIIADKMPILIDGEIKDIFDKQRLNIYINSKPQQDFIDKYINKNQVYPIKIKGDIVYWAKLKGFINDLDLKVKIDMNKDSSIYHFGATVGDLENAISIYHESKITNGNHFKIKEFSYDKIIDSLSGKQTELNLLKARGGVKILKDSLVFDDLRIKTSHPTDARIFNIIFRKPNIKQGQFTSDLKIDGDLTSPRIIGDFHIFETDIPFLDTTVKNIELIFKDKTVSISSKGDILGNDFEFSGIVKNKLTKPYFMESGNLYTKNLDLNRIINKLKVSEVENITTFNSSEDFELNTISFDNFRLKADNIELRNIHATNFQATTKLTEKGLFNVNKFSFDIAQGLLDGKYQYNLKNNDMSLKLDVKDISANDITLALFDLNNQIHGDMTGTVDLSCNGANFDSCMQTLNGNSAFNVINGKMPKLGSLEYLLKAANLVKGGLTGVSLNSVIDVIAPQKNGEFSDIYGLIKIKDGIAKNIDITSKGKCLNLYINGTYDFSTSIADMQVFGLLSRKLSTMFGPIGNLSINTLFNIIPGIDLSKDSSILEKINKIPGIELSSKAYRKFVADIKGNINGDDYVTSFQWIN